MPLVLGLDVGTQGSRAIVAVDSTSGTIVAVDERGRPLMPAIMYNDTRAYDERYKSFREECARRGFGLKL